VGHVDRRSAATSAAGRRHLRVFKALYAMQPSQSLPPIRI
jgi:hypothetical protein